MPGDYIVNPRRQPRAAVRCEARVALREGGYFAAPTYDYGPGGCQLPTPEPLRPGTRIFVELAHANTPIPFRLSGRVAWAKADPTSRAGIAFDDASARPAARLYERVIGAAPAMDDAPSAPERLSVEAALAPAPPPELPPALTPDEVVVLAAVGDGLTAGALRAKLGDRWEVAVNALFALLGRRVLVVGPPDRAAAIAWVGLSAPR